MFGGAWFAHRILFDIPWPAAIAVVLALFGLVTGSVIRFEIVKLRGRGYEDADRGYVLLSGGDLGYVVTDRWELGPTAIRLWTMGHILTVPLVLAVLWFRPRPARRRRVVSGTADAP